MSFLGTARKLIFIFKEDSAGYDTNIFFPLTILISFDSTVIVCNSGMASIDIYILPLIFGGVGSLKIKFAASPEGVSYAILIMNILVPYINRLTLRKPFGFVKPVKVKEGKSDE